jgi:hypothetical protein
MIGSDLRLQLLLLGHRRHFSSAESTDLRSGLDWFSAPGARTAILLHLNLASVGLHDRRRRFLTRRNFGRRLLEGFDDPADDPEKEAEPETLGASARQ